MSTTQTKYISKFSGSRILVLGGTSGIRFCVAEASIEHGATVIISGSSQSRLDNAISRLQTSYPDASNRISGHTCDLAQPDTLEQSPTRLLFCATADGIKLDHIAFTAGDAIKVTPLAEATVEDIRKAGNVRFLGALILAKLAPKYLNPGPGTSMTFTGGTNTDRPMPGWTLMAAYGGAIEGMVRGLAVDLKPVRVNLVSPGAVHTELFDSVPVDRMEDFCRR